MAARPNPYSGFRDDHERRLALRSRDLRLVAIAAIGAVSAISAISAIRAASAALQAWPWLQAWFH